MLNQTLNKKKMENKDSPISAENLYKLLIQNENPSDFLSSFVSQAESYNSKTSNLDIVKDYLHVSGNCNEILQLIKKIPSADCQTVMDIMNTLCHLLLRIANDLHAFSLVGTSIVNEILDSGMRSVFNFLKRKQKPSRTKMTVHLLCSMIALGGQTAHRVVSKLDFSNLIFTHLLNRKNISEEEDVRTAFINLIILIMTTCEFTIIRQLVEVKGFLNDVLHGLVSDRPHVITLVLSTFRKLIVENSGISKTTKLKLFNDHSLKPVIKLYSWKGPIRDKTNKKRKLGEKEQSTIYEASEEEIQSVQSNAHEFMMSLCCSFKFGIIFYDSSFGSSGKNQNHVLTNILSYMPRPHTNKLASDLVVSVLKTCPDQLIYYLPILKGSFTPRVSSQWLDAMNVLKRIILAQDPVSCLFKYGEKKSVSSLISIAKSLCFPNLIEPSEICSAFKNGQPFVCYHIADFLICILNKVKDVLKFCSHSDFSKTSYSPADMSAFSQSLLATMLQNFSFMKDLQNFWEKQTSSVVEVAEKINTDLPLPSLYHQLSKILEVIQQFLILFSSGYENHDINIPKFFQSLKGCHSLLSHDEICSLNIKIVDIISVQGEDAIILWNKNSINSPLMVLLDIYLTTPSASMIEDVSQILHKILIHTKVFEFCPWETDVWLDIMKSSKVKHIPFIIEFINNSMYTLLQNPCMFSDDIIETSSGESKSTMSLDVITMLNDLLSTEKSPILIEDFKESSNISSTPKLCFSALVPAALFTLQSIDSDKKKGCQSFMEKVLYHIMHHQNSSEILLSVILKYKENICNNLYNYFELLCPSKYERKLKYEDASKECKEDLSDHLKVKFISLHSLQDSSKGCHCVIQCEPQNLSPKYKEKIVWQLMTYLDWEITLFLEEKILKTDILNYISLLETLLNSLKESNTSTDEVMEITDSKPIEEEDIKWRIVEEVLSCPVLLKFFLWAEKIPRSKKKITKDFISRITNLVLNLVAEAVSNGTCHKYLMGFKDKVVKLICLYFQTENVPKHLVILENPDIYLIITNFSSVFSANDITTMLEDLLIVETEGKLENYFSIMSVVFKMYIELNECTLLSPNAINSLFIKYADLSKKQKKILREYVMPMFKKHPALASAVDSHSTSILLKQSSSKNFYILGCLIDSNDSLRQHIEASIIENLEELKNTPDFIYLVSKCILNSTVNECVNTHFLETVSPFFWEAVTNYILMDIESPDTLLENSGAGKAVQILFHRKILPVKKMNKFFKTNAEALTAVVPSPTKIVIFLQFMEVWKNCIVESKKSLVSLQKMTFQWLLSVISSFQSISEFSYFPLIHFTINLLQSISEINLSDLLEPDTFFSKILKVALKQRKIGSQLIKIITLVYKKSQNLPTESIFNLVTGHSNFFNTMLSQIEENENLKECVVDLLIALVSKDKTVCKDSHIGLLLSSYTGTLKSLDQKLLFLIKLYSETDVDMSKFSPFLWSKTAVVHYSVMNSGTMNLWRKPKLQDLLNIFSLEMIESTVKKYPLTLKLEPSIEDSNEELVGDLELSKIYDLRFFLPLLASVLSPGSFVHCSNFMNSRVLMLIFASLSSLDVDTRALGYYCLSQIYFHLEGANYREKQIWLCLLDSLRNSITSENPRLPSIVSLFLARVALVFTKPDNPMYSILYKFIMVKPTVDISQVPEFYKLFNSIDIEYREQRMWLLKLLADGMRSSLDFHVCEKRYISSLLLTHYWSSVSTPEEKVVILNFIIAAVKINVPTKVLLQNSLLSFINNGVIDSSSTNIAVCKSLVNLLNTLWSSSRMLSENSTEDTEENKKTLPTSFPKEFQMVSLNLLEKLKNLDVSSVNSYLFTIHDVLKNYDVEAETQFSLSLEHISQILDCWLVMSEKKDKQECVDKTMNDATNFKQSCVLFTKILLIWSPNWKTNRENCYRNQLLYVIKSVQLMLKYHDLSSLYTSDLPIWLYRCFKQDDRHELVKLLFSSKGDLCLRSILDFFEKSLNHQSQFYSMKNNVQLCDDLKLNVENGWGKILKYFKKVSNSYNLTPELNLYHQITMIL